MFSHVYSGWAQSEDEILMVFPIPPDSTSKLVRLFIVYCTVTIQNL